MQTGKKVIIIGGVAAGTSAAARLRRMTEDIEITLYEKYKYISYATCGLPYFVSGKIQNVNELLVSTVESFNTRFNVNVKNLHEVIKIMPREKSVIVRNLKTGEEFTDNYDKLIIATGASVIDLKIKESDASNIFNLKTIDDALKIRKYIESQVKPYKYLIDDKEINPTQITSAAMEGFNNIKTNVVIVGGGFIGLEMLEAFLDKNLSVVIIEKTNQLLPSFDKEIVDYAENYLNEQGIFILKEEEISIFEKDREGIVKTVKTLSGKTIETDLILMGIGVKPENSLAKDAGIEIGGKGAIIVDQYMQTSISDIYAAGDCAECNDMISNDKKGYYLASVASKQGRIAANNIAVNIIGESLPGNNNISRERNLKEKKYVGSIGTAIIKILNIAVAKTGLSFREAKKLYPDAEKLEIHFLSHAGYYPGASMMHMILIYDKNSRHILGFEAIGRDGIDKKTDIISAAIKGKLKLDDMAYCDFAYQPEFGAAKDPVNMIGMIGENLFDGEVEFINCEDLRDILNKDSNTDKTNNNGAKDSIQNLTRNDIFILDVRTQREFEAGYIESANLIPINILRENLNKIDGSKTVIIYCRTGYRAYMGYRLLKNKGFKNVKCLNGSYLSWDRKM